ncbi:MAG: glycoside hydrolase family 9 protein [Bacteroidota bacterium]
MRTSFLWIPVWVFSFTTLWSNTTVVYDDALANDWADWSWGGNYDFSQTSQVQVGTNAIAATYTDAYGGLNLRKDNALNGSSITSIRFWVKSNGAHDIRVYTASEDGDGASQDKVIVTTAAWQQITINMNELGSPSVIKRLIFQNLSEDTNFTVYYDQIELLTNDEPPISEVLIRVDQFGYLPDAEKVAVLSDPQLGDNANLSYNPPAQLEVRDANTDAIVYTGNISIWNNGNTHSQSGDKGWWFDFSNVTASGDYYVYDATNDGRSAIFKIGNDVYNGVMQAAFKMFYYNRCNIEKVEPYVAAGYVDGISFTNPLQDANCRSVNDRNNAATEKDLTGGWFDAGDYNKYVTFTLSVMHNLLWAYEENPELFGDDWNIPESDNGIPDLLDEIKWELDWLLKMTNSDGSVHIKMGTIDYSQNGDSPPSSNTDFPRYYGPTCTSASITNAGIFAHAAKVFANIPSMSNYAQTLENQAIRTWNYSLPFLNSNTLETECDDGTIKAGDADRDAEEQREDALVAAVHLFDLTGNSSYEQYVINNLNDAEQITTPFWGCYKLALNDALLLYTTLPNTNSNTVNTILNAANTDVNNNGSGFFGFSNADLYRASMPDWSYHWGSNQASAGYGVVNLQMKKYGILPASADNYERKASEQVHYFHGVNPMGLVYLSNMYDEGGDACVNEMYHAWFNDGNPLYDNVQTSTYGPPPGYLVGGPNDSYTVSSLSPPYGEPRQKAYLDFNTSSPFNSWEISEPAIYYQAVYLRLLAPYIGNLCVSRLDDNDVGLIADEVIYQASESITFSGIIAENSDVRFQAGDFISLQDGFVAKNTTFSAFIGNCHTNNGQPEREAITEDRAMEIEKANNIVSKNIQVFPNPTRATISVAYQVKYADLVKISILDRTGQVVQTVSYPQQAVGQHEERFSLTWQSDGIYLVMVQIGESMASRKLVLNK